MVCCGTTENPGSSVPALAVLEGLTEFGCDVVVAAGTTGVNLEDEVGKRESLPTIPSASTSVGPFDTVTPTGPKRRAF